MVYVSDFTSLSRVISQEEESCGSAGFDPAIAVFGNLDDPVTGLQLGGQPRLMRPEEICGLPAGAVLYAPSCLLFAAVHVLLFFARQVPFP